MKAFAFALAFAAVQATTCESDTDLIKSAEGYRSCMYYDTQGYKTICYGYNLDQSGAQQEVTSAGGDYNDAINGGCLSQSVCNNLLNDAVSSAEAGEQSIYGNVSCYCAKEVLVDMTYNLGVSGLSGFYTFNSYIEEQNWDAAADDLYGTLWCSQVGNRCSRDAEQIRACDSQSAFLQ